MFRSKTVFIVGAGASCELGFPSGSQLLEQIAESLDIYFGDGFNMSRGDHRLYDALARGLSEADRDVVGGQAVQFIKSEYQGYYKAVLPHSTV